MVTTNLLASSTEGGQFSVLGPDETVGPDTPEWRAISMTVPDDRAVGGLLTPNQTVDVFVTASVNVLTNPEDGIGEEGYYTDKSTKISYQNMLILAKAGHVLHPQGADRRRRGDLAPAGQRRVCLQPGACGRTRTRARSTPPPSGRRPTR